MDNSLKMTEDMINEINTLKKNPKEIYDNTIQSIANVQKFLSTNTEYENCTVLDMGDNEQQDKISFLYPIKVKNETKSFTIEVQGVSMIGKLIFRVNEILKYNQDEITEGDLNRGLGELQLEMGRITLKRDDTSYYVNYLHDTYVRVKLLDALEFNDIMSAIKSTILKLTLFHSNGSIQAVMDQIRQRMVNIVENGLVDNSDSALENTLNMHKDMDEMVEYLRQLQDRKLIYEGKLSKLLTLEEKVTNLEQMFQFENLQEPSVIEK